MIQEYNNLDITWILPKKLFFPGWKNFNPFLDRSFGARGETRNLIDGEFSSDSDDDFFLTGPSRPIPDKNVRLQDVKLQNVKDQARVHFRNTKDSCLN